MIARTDVSERAVLYETVTRREGRTIATVIGSWPVVLLGAALVIAGWILARGPVGTPPTAGDP